MVTPAPFAHLGTVQDFQPIRADWSSKRDLARCARWLKGQSSFKEALERRTARNIAFYEGRQNYEWDPRQRIMRLPDRSSRKMTMIYNVAKTLIQQRQSRIVRYENAWNVPAATSDEFDQMIARFSNSVMEWYWTDGVRMPDKLHDLTLWMMLSPLTFVHPNWNPAKGRMRIVPLDDFYRPTDGLSPDQSETRRQQDIEEFRRLRGYDEADGVVKQSEGDLDFQIVDIFRAMWYPFWARTDEDIRIFLKTDIMTADEISIRYGMTPGEIDKYRRSTMGIDEGRARYARLSAQWSNPLTPDTRLMNVDGAGGIAVHQLYVSKELAPPYGVSAIILGDSDEAVSIGTLGNRYGEFPFRSIVESPSPNTLWGTCTMDDLIAPSLDINLAKTRQAEYRDIMVSPRIVRDKQDGADSESFKADARDAVIEVNEINTRMPRVLHVPPHGIEDESAVAFDLRFMHDASAVPDVALGNTSETNARSGIAVRSLQEEAAQRMKVAGIRLDSIISWAGSLSLSLLQEYAAGERLIPLAGDNNATEYFTWSRASLRPSTYDKQTSSVAIVKCTAFSNIPSTPIEARNTMATLISTGFIRPGEHDSLVHGVFGLNDIETYVDKDRRDRDKQQNEISLWKQGKPVPPPAITDNHKVQREVLDPWIASDEGQRIIASNPLLAQDILNHREAHAQGEYDEIVRQQLRLQWATMRVNAEFAERAANAGLVPQSQLFIAQSYAGMLPGVGGADMSAGTDMGAGSGTGSSRTGERPRGGGADNAPINPGAPRQVSSVRPNNDPSSTVQRAIPMGRDREIGSNV